MARTAPEPRGVVAEAVRAQRAQAARGEVLEAAERIEQLAASRPRHAEGDGVDAEIAPREILVDRRAGAHLGQRAGPRVALAAQPREVDPLPAQLDPCGGEARLPMHRDDLAASVAQPRRRRGGEGGGVPTAGEVQLGRRDAGCEVADRAADGPQFDAQFRGGLGGGVEQGSRVGGQGSAQPRKRRTYKRVIYS